MISDINVRLLTFVVFFFFIWTNLIYVRPVRCARWRTLTQSVGRISQPFRLKLEFTEGKKIPSHAAVDNIRLLSCLTGLPFPSNAPVLVGEGAVSFPYLIVFLSLLCCVWLPPHRIGYFVLGDHISLSLVTLQTTLLLLRLFVFLPFPSEYVV